MDIVKNMGISWTYDEDLGLDVYTVIKNVLSAAFLIGGVVAVCVIIYGGILMSSSAGDAAKVQTAKKAITYAVSGLVVCIFAFAIVNFVLAKL